MDAELIHKVVQRRKPKCKGYLLFVAGSGLAEHQLHELQKDRVLGLVCDLLHTFDFRKQLAHYQVLVELFHACKLILDLELIDGIQKIPCSAQVR